MARGLPLVAQRSVPRDTAAAAPAWTRSNASARVLRRLLSSRGIVLGGVVLVIVGIVALSGPLLAPYDPLAQHPELSLDPPTLAHPFGTDLLGRDVLSRAIVGARQSLLVALVAISIAVTVGTLIGLASGFYEGWVDLLLQRLIEIQLAFPGLLLALAIVAVLGPGLGNAMIAVGISLIPSYARMVRASVLTVKHNAYVEAARVIGCGDVRVIATHILPNVAVPILVLTTVGIAWAILIGSSLSFLGLGAQPPFAEWGRDLSEGRNYMAVAWWVSTFPGLAILFTIVSVNLFGDGLRDTLDPRLRQR
ncbi:MAG TPA: ABC transporter permease [Chloroflexota bacterium]|nr:ABC transporter permease [Chloroflexota bacterium]